MGENSDGHHSHNPRQSCSVCLCPSQVQQCCNNSTESSTVPRLPPNLPLVTVTHVASCAGSEEAGLTAIASFNASAAPPQLLAQSPTFGSDEATQPGVVSAPKQSSNETELGVAEQPAEQRRLGGLQ